MGAMEMKMELLKLNDKIETSWSNYESAIGDFEGLIGRFVDFDFSITYCGGDGQLLLNYDTASVAPLLHVINEIVEHGIYTNEQHEKGCI